MRRAKKGAGSRAQAPRVTFRDVAGVDAAKEELLEVVACLRDAQRYARLNARMPSGVLLSGPPGTGKTLLARAVAGEAGVPFFSCTASEFVELFVGRGAARIRELFAEARSPVPCTLIPRPARPRPALYPTTAPRAGAQARAGGGVHR